MFRARCVPNMYLFGTFSAQNAEEIAARSALRGGRDGSGQQPLASGATTRRKGLGGGIRPPPRLRRH
jgi:hypothetical protein